MMFKFAGIVRTLEKLPIGIIATISQIICPRVQETEMLLLNAKFVLASRKLELAPQIEYS